MAARKKTTTGKPAAKKAATPKRKAAAGTAKKAAKKEGGVSSLSVNLGHLFALRPRVETSFRPDDLRIARQQLQDESYATLHEAARAVAEKAIELTREPKKRRGPR